MNNHKSFIFLILFIFGQSTISVNSAEIVDYVSSNEEISDSEYKILKLQSKIDNLYIEISNLKKQIEQLDNNQSSLNTKVNNFLSKHDVVPSDNSVPNDNNAEFQYGFNMLVSGSYEIARKSFELFIEKYPNDKKIGEAYFWLGEIAYKNKQYKQASKYYLICYRDYKNNARRNHALFKLSVTLGLLKKLEESCAGFDIIINDVMDIGSELRGKAKKEFINFGCQNIIKAQ